MPNRFRNIQEMFLVVTLALWVSACGDGGLYREHHNVWDNYDIYDQPRDNDFEYTPPAGYGQCFPGDIGCE